ncbi:MAG: hypothetical protein ABSE49_23910, partial [Polyangiaceae bacterium]
MKFSLLILGWLMCACSASDRPSGGPGPVDSSTGDVTYSGGAEAAAPDSGDTGSEDASCTCPTPGVCDPS